MRVLLTANPGRRTLSFDKAESGLENVHIVAAELADNQFR